MQNFNGITYVAFGIYIPIYTIHIDIHIHAATLHSMRMRISQLYYCFNVDFSECTHDSYYIIRYKLYAMHSIAFV